MLNTYYDENVSEADLQKHAFGVLTCAMFCELCGHGPEYQLGWAG